MDVLRVEWTVFNPRSDFIGSFQQIGGYIGTGDQSNYLKLSAISHPDGEFEAVLEDGDVTWDTDYIQANNLFDAPASSRIRLRYVINLRTGIARPSATYELRATDLF